MYREPSPVFDLHEFPPLRRVKPLPKRRGNTVTAADGLPVQHTHQPGSAEGTTEQVYNAQIPLEMLDEPLNGSITTEQFIANAEFLTRKISQTIYMNHIPDIAQNILDSLGKAGATSSYPPGVAGPSEGPDTVEVPLVDPREPRPNHEGLSRAIQADVDLISEAAMQARALPAELLRNITEKLSIPSITSPGLNSSSGHVDIDAIFAAGYEAGLNGAGLNGGQYRNGMPQSRQTPFYRPQYHQSSEASSQGASIEGMAGEEGFGDGATTAPVTPSIQSRQILHGEISIDIRRRTGRNEEEEDDDYGEDRQPGPNYSKKRKVPANAGMSHLRGEGRGDDIEGEDGVSDPYTAQRVGVTGAYEEDQGGTMGSADAGLRDPAGDEEAQDPELHNCRMRQAAQQTLLAPQLASMRTSRMPLSTLSTMTMSASSAARVGQSNSIVKARGKLTAAMVAGVQSKETLKARKRQLAAVMGALTQGDSVALDQALLMAGSAYPFGGPLGMAPTALFSKESTPKLEGGKENAGEEEKGNHVKTRASKRPSARLARAAKSILPAPACADETKIPASDFAFACPSLTAERLLATKEEVATLRNRFEAELERQAMNAAKLAAASKAPPPLEDAEDYVPVTTNAPTKSKKREKGKSKGGSEAKVGTAQQHQAQQQAAARNPTSSKAQAPPQGQPIDPSQHLPPPSKPKKKKRSALANASNPHHLRNYVPSRLPQSAGGHNPNAALVAQSFLGPPPLRFLSADLPPPRGSKAKKGGRIASVTTSSSLGSIAGGGGDEWICLFCEYDLFYGDDTLFRRGVKNRKKVLKRRRRARERAAAAASGVKSGLKAASGGAAAPANSPNAPPPATTVEDYASDEEGNDGEDDYDGDPGYEQGVGGMDGYENAARHGVGVGYHRGYVKGEIGAVG